MCVKRGRRRPARMGQVTRQFSSLHVCDVANLLIHVKDKYGTWLIHLYAWQAREAKTCATVSSHTAIFHRHMFPRGWLTYTRERQIWDMAHSPVCVTGEGGEDLRIWVASHCNFYHHMFVTWLTYLYVKDKYGTWLTHLYAWQAREAKTCATGSSPTAIFHVCSQARRKWKQM